MGNRHHLVTDPGNSVIQTHLLISELTKTTSVELSEAVLTVSSFSAVVVLLQTGDGANLTPAGWILRGGVPGEVELTESASGDGPGARALALGVTLVYSEDDNPGDELPLWAIARGFTTGLVIPLIKHGRPFGAVYAIRRDLESPSATEINLAELAVVHGGRTLPVLTHKQWSEDDEAEEMAGFSPAVYESVRDLAPLRFDGLHIDPVREQARLGDVDVSLSRTEFLMLYTLGKQPNEIVPHHVLLEICWPDDFPALSAVDATVYRLRKKLSLAAVNAGKQMVKTVRGKGYMLAAGG